MESRCVRVLLIVVSKFPGCSVFLTLISSPPLLVWSDYILCHNLDASHHIVSFSLWIAIYGDFVPSSTVHNVPPPFVPCCDYVHTARKHVAVLVWLALVDQVWKTPILRSST